ncbi:MAG: right-handed parallel beta-helix repeat-containing protein [Terriglobales bacterium]
MRTAPIRRLLISASLALVIAQAALARPVVVGTCLSHLQTYSTISQAVAAVASGSTILICPGSYPEQVTIKQPLTLRGVRSGTAANPTVTVPPGGLTQSVISPNNGIKMYFQILVLGTGTGLVNIENLAINGSNNEVSNGWLEGVYYQNSSGVMNNLATYNQTGNGYGFGVFLESTTSDQKPVTVSHCSIHDFDAEGIRTNGNANLTVNIRSNAVVVSPSTSLQINGIDIYGIGTVSDNSVATRPGLQGGAGIGIATESGVTISNNTIVGMVIGIWPLGNSNVVFSNRVSFANSAVVLSGTDNDVEHNHFYPGEGGAGVDFNCTGTGNTVIHNLFNDADWGIVSSGGSNTVTPNSFSNVAQLISPPC